MNRYIQRHDPTSTPKRETVDQFPFDTREERQEARRCLAEYRLADPSAHHYLSPRACKDWNPTP